MKIFAISGDKKWIKIGNDFSSAEWYGTERVSNFIKDLNKGDEVEIRFSKNNAGKNILDYIKTINVKQDISSPTSTSIGTSNITTNKDEHIKRLSILRAVAEAVNALAGQVDLHNIGDVMEELYDRFYTKISTHDNI